jgi:hypothetical protein
VAQEDNLGLQPGLRLERRSQCMQQQAKEPNHSPTLPDLMGGHCVDRVFGRHRESLPTIPSLNRFYGQKNGSSGNHRSRRRREADDEKAPQQVEEARRSADAETRRLADEALAPAQLGRQLAPQKAARKAETEAKYKADAAAKQQADAYVATALGKKSGEGAETAFRLSSSDRQRICVRQAGDDRSLAPCWLSGLLALVIAQARWQTESLS